MGCFPAVPSLALSRTLPSSAPAVTSPPIGSVDPQSLPPLPQREQKRCSVRRWVAVEVHCQEQLDKRISMPICIKDAILCCQYKQ
uniref:Uncharacterized protein n=1 Tax=Oryza barthii TaxID=65489 RepID=A0A0D3FF86_9ORYZ